MVGLPNVGSDAGVWGTELNAFLSVAHNSNGTVNGPGSGLDPRYALFNVDTYDVTGTPGNGTVDDTPAWHLARSAAISAGGGTVKFRTGGHYMLNDLDFSPSATAQVPLKVEAAGSILQHNASAGGVFVNFSGTVGTAPLFNCALSGTPIIMPKQSSVSPTTDTVYVTYCYSSSFDGWVFDPAGLASPSGSAMHIFARAGAGVYYNKFNLRVRPNKASGFPVSYPGNGLTVDGLGYGNANHFWLEISDTAGIAFNDLGQGNNVVHFADFESNAGYGIVMNDATTGVEFLHCRLENNNGGSFSQWSLPATPTNPGMNLFIGSNAHTPTDAERGYWGLCLDYGYVNNNNLNFYNPRTFGSLNILGSFNDNFTTISAGPVTLGNTYSFILASTGGGALTLNLPSASGIKGRKYIIKRGTAGGANACNIVPNGTDNIDGANTTYSLTAPLSQVTLVSDGASNWYIQTVSYPIDATATDISAAGTQTAGALGKLTDSGHVHPENAAAIASDYTISGVALKAWNYDLLLAGVAGGGTFSTFPAAGTVYLARVNIRQPITPTKVVIWNNAPTGTGSGYYLALFNSSGTQLGSTSSDQFASSGGLLGVSVGTPGALSAGTYVYVALLIATQGGTTKGGAEFFPLLGQAPIQYSGGTTSAYRWAINGTGASVMPGSLTPASNASSLYAFWCGLV